MSTNNTQLIDWKLIVPAIQWQFRCMFLHRKNYTALCSIKSDLALTKNINTDMLAFFSTMYYAWTDDSHKPGMILRERKRIKVLKRCSQNILSHLTADKINYIMRDIILGRHLYYTWWEITHYKGKSFAQAHTLNISYLVTYCILWYMLKKWILHFDVI